MGAKEMRQMQHRIILEPVGENEVDEGVSVMQEEQKWRRGGEVGPQQDSSSAESRR